MNNPQEMSALIKKIVSEKPFSLSKMLSDIGLGRNTMSHMDNGSSPKVESIAKIADYLNVSVDYLLGRTEHASNNITNSGTNNGTQANIINNEKSDYNINEQKLIEKFRELDYDEQIGVLADVIGKTKE